MGKLLKKRPRRQPSHPGAILSHVWLKELNMTQYEFAEKLVDLSPVEVKHSTMQTKISELINGRRALSAEFAVLIGKALETDPKMWLNLQTNFDIWQAEEKFMNALPHSS